MAVYTVVYKARCSPTGGHIVFTLKRDGVAVKDITVMVSDLLTNDLTVEDVLPFFLRQCIKAAGATTLVEARIAVESAQWVI